MLTEYLGAAMHQATYDLLPDGEGYYGEIAALPGANQRDCVIYARFGVAKRDVPSFPASFVLSPPVRHFPPLSALASSCPGWLCP